MIEKAVLLNGSPREGETTSGSLGGHMMGSLRAKGIETTMHVISRALMTKELCAEMMKDVRSSGIIVLSYPSYVDSPPSDVVRWMELVRDDTSIDIKGVMFLAIGHCDEIDPKRLDVAMDIVHNFSDSKGMRWAGGLKMPMGPAIDGVPLISSGKRGRKAAKALEMTVAALVRGEAAPEEAFELMASRPMHEMLYVMRTNRAWKRHAIQKQTRMLLLDRPLIK